VADVTLASNAGFGAFADETGDGTGTVTVTEMRGAANALGATGGSATFVFQP